MSSSRLSQPIPGLNRRRRFLKWVASLSLSLLSDLRIEGTENLPESGPLIVVSNHFHFGDPAAIVCMVPWPIEFIGDATTPNAPLLLSWIRNIWGYLLIRRGGFSREGLLTAANIIKEGGVLFVAPEAGSWAPVLRPPRPGVSFLATRTGAPILPVGLVGLNDIFPSLRRGRRAKVTIRIGPVFGPFEVTGRGRQRRRQVDDIGHVIMQHIAPLIPPEQRGCYSDDPQIREAAAAAAVYPWGKHNSASD
jgi:1-acyl-sn-glycerol-3-phosphate acyltransferase